MVRLTYYTDPACPWSWAAEPALRRLQMEFGDEAQITYVMAGMERELNDPLHLLDATLEAAAWSGMPVDPRIWRERPPHSTYPACQAVKAAAEQDRDGPYLRVLREAIMCGRRPMDNADALVDAAREIEGLDVARFEIDLRSHAIVEAFAADLERNATRPTRELPTFVFETHPHPANEYAGRVAPDALAPGRARPVAEVLERFGTVAAAEVAACCDLPLARARAELWQLASQWRARPEPVGGFGELWSPGL
jgi:predicted DsbA family dithiol-disulfide isomerase